MSECMYTLNKYIFLQRFPSFHWFLSLFSCFHVCLGFAVVGLSSSCRFFESAVPWPEQTNTITCSCDWWTVCTHNGRRCARVFVWLHASTDSLRVCAVAYISVRNPPQSVDIATPRSTRHQRARHNDEILCDLYLGCFLLQHALLLLITAGMQAHWTETVPIWFSIKIAQEVRGTQQLPVYVVAWPWFFASLPLCLLPHFYTSLLCICTAL